MSIYDAEGLKFHFTTKFIKYIKVLQRTDQGIEIHIF